MLIFLSFENQFQCATKSSAVNFSSNRDHQVTSHLSPSQEGEDACNRLKKGAFLT